MKAVRIFCGLLAGALATACGEPEPGEGHTDGGPSAPSSGGAAGTTGGSGGDDTKSGAGGAQASGGAASSGGSPSSGGAASSGGSGGSSGGSDGATGGEGGCAGPFFASELADFSFPPPRNASDAYGRERLPDVLFGPPGSATSVVSLGNGGSVTVTFGQARIVDGPGVDFIVFENPFPGNAELATISVSADGVEWHTFPCVAEQKRSDSPLTDYGQCAGWRAVGPAGSDYTNPSQAGGDPYDLADLGIVDLPPIRYVRVTDRADLVEDPQDPTSPKSDSFDLNAVSLVHAICL